MNHLITYKVQCKDLLIDKSAYLVNLTKSTFDVTYV